MLLTSVHDTPYPKGCWMSGVVGHLMYAILGAKAARARGVRVDLIVDRHQDSYLCGAYLGCDIQTLPEAICIGTGEPVGYGTVPLERSPLTGGPVRPWTLEHAGRSYRPRDIHRLLYGRTHLVFGWAGAERVHTVPWEHLADYAADVFHDALHLYAPGERQLAYLFGWLTHIVGDSLIKSVRPGIDLNLIDGKYTAKNRPIQDLVTFHEIGRKELGLRWDDLLADMAAAPVEPIQLHYMRVTKPQGRLATSFSNAWNPELQSLAMRVCAENRAYQRIRTARLLKKYRLVQRNGEWHCSKELSAASGGLTYSEMVKAAERAGFRRALWQMGEAVARLMIDVVERVPELAERLRGASNVSWEELERRWKRP